MGTIDHDRGPRDDTWTRSELLTQRGYPEAIVNGNGRHAGEEVTPTPAMTAVAISTDEPPESGARSCSECGGPLAAGRPKTCGPECANVARRRRDRERKRASSRPALETVPLPSSNGGGSPGPDSTASPLELEAVTPAELKAIPPPAEELATVVPPAAQLEAGAGVANKGSRGDDPILATVSLADELEAAAGLLRRIAGRLVG